MSGAFESCSAEVRFIEIENEPTSVPINLDLFGKKLFLWIWYTLIVDAFIMRRCARFSDYKTVGV